MPNQNYTSVGTDRKGSGRASPSKKKPMSERFNQKPGFNVSLPGKAQPSDRSAGYKRCPIYPDSKGL